MHLLPARADIPVPNDFHELGGLNIRGFEDLGQEKTLAGEEGEYI